MRKSMPASCAFAVACGTPIQTSLANTGESAPPFGATAFRANGVVINRPDQALPRELKRAVQAQTFYVGYTDDVSAPVLKRIAFENAPRFRVGSAVGTATIPHPASTHGQ